MLPLVPHSATSFKFVDPHVLSDYAERLPLYQKAAKHSPLRAGYKFPITCPSRSHPLGRELDPVLQSGGTLELELVHSVMPPHRVQSNRSSAVWLAKVVTADGTVTPTTPSVVVKLLQPSQLPYPQASTFNMEPWRRSTSPDWLARSESAGYDRLCGLQGTVIPYFFGKHIVR